MHLRPVRPLALLAAAAVLALGQPVLGQPAIGQPAVSAADTAPTGDAAAPVVRQPWWSAFEDTRLDALMVPLQSPAAGDPAALLQAQADTVRAYALLRVAGVRLHNARQRQQVAEQRQLALQTAEEASATTRRAAARGLREARQQVERLQAEQLARVADVATRLRSRHPAEILGPLLRGASEDTQVLLPRFHLMDELPGVVLRRRPDVARVEASLAPVGRGLGADALDLARYLQAMSLPIRASEQPPRLLRLAWPGVGSVMAQAREEVAFHLWQLGAATVATREQHAHVARLAQLWQHLRDQQQAGRVGELQVLDAMDEALQAEDQLAASAGELVRAWVALQLSVGGAGRTELESLLEQEAPAR